MTYDPETSFYRNPDGRIKIYCGDMFKWRIEEWGPFDCIWDRGSFVAMDYPLREAYFSVMKRAVGYGSGEFVCLGPICHGIYVKQ